RLTMSLAKAHTLCTMSLSVTWFQLALNSTRLPSMVRRWSRSSRRKGSSLFMPPLCHCPDGRSSSGGGLDDRGPGLWPAAEQAAILNARMQRPTSRVDHPNIVSIYDCGIDRGEPY